MKRRSTILIAAAAVLTMAVMPASAASLATKALKGAAIGYAVNQSAGTLNKFINTITLNPTLNPTLTDVMVMVIVKEIVKEIYLTANRQKNRR